jgi:hypothetical protein
MNSVIIKRLIYTYKARQMKHKLIKYRRRVTDFCEYAVIRQQYYNTLEALKAWRKSCHKVLTLTRFVRVCSYTKCKRGFKKMESNV